LFSTSTSLVNESPPIVEDKNDIYNQRQEFENYLKIAVSVLSHATSAGDLVKMLRVTAYLDRQDVSLKLLDYLSP
jgi:hypothetical protein